MLSLLLCIAASQCLHAAAVLSMRCATGSSVMLSLLLCIAASHCLYAACCAANQASATMLMPLYLMQLLIKAQLQCCCVHFI